MSYRIFDVTVAAVERLSPHFVRAVLESPALADVARGGPDQRIKLLFPGPGLAEPEGDDWFGAWRALPAEQRPPMRTYSLRDADPAARTITVDFVAHGDTGPASRWIGSAVTGDRLLAIAPDATKGEPAGGAEWKPGNATTVLVAGDETAVPAIAAILESLDEDARGAAFLEVPEPDDRLVLGHPAGVEVTWLPRGTAHVGEALDAAVRAWAAANLVRAGDGDESLLNPGTDILWEVPEAPTAGGFYAWLAGEAGAITALRRHLVRDLGVDRSRVAFMGYWKLGRAEN